MHVGSTEYYGHHVLHGLYKQDDWGLAADLHAYRNAVGNLRELYRRQDALKLQIQAEYEQ